MGNNKPKYNHAGQPTVMTPLILAKLDQAFAIGCTDVEACAYAEIAEATLYSYQSKNPEYAEHKAQLKEKPILKAKNNVIAAMNEHKTPLVIKGVLITHKDGSPILLEDPDDRDIRIKTSQWYLERKKKDEFSARSELTGKDGKDLIDPNEPKTLETLLKTAATLFERPTDDTTGDPTPPKKNKTP
jgi:hypothetical protein